MQLPSLLQFDPHTPMDNDFFTIDTTDWLATSAPQTDLLSAVTCVVTNMDDSAQTSVNIVAGPTIDSTSTLVTVWLSGGTPNTGYLVRFHLTTVLGRSDWKSVGLYIVPDRS